MEHQRRKTHVSVYGGTLNRNELDGFVVDVNIALLARSSDLFDMYVMNNSFDDYEPPYCIGAQDFPNGKSIYCIIFKYFKLLENRLSPSQKNGEEPITGPDFFPIHEIGASVAEFYKKLNVYERDFFWLIAGFQGESDMLHQSALRLKKGDNYTNMDLFSEVAAAIDEPFVERLTNVMQVVNYLSIISLHDFCMCLLGSIIFDQKCSEMCTSIMDASDKKRKDVSNTRSQAMQETQNSDKHQRLDHAKTSLQVFDEQNKADAQQKIRRGSPFDAEPFLEQPNVDDIDMDETYMLLYNALTRMDDSADGQIVAIVERLTINYGNMLNNNTYRHE